MPSLATWSTERFVSTAEELAGDELTVAGRLEPATREVVFKHTGGMRRSSMGLVVGVDACRQGWVAVLAEDGDFVASAIAPTFADLLASLPEAVAVGVDIPIGLPSEGPRAADVAARAFVGPRRSSVFPTPTHAALNAASYAEARIVSPSLSAQSFAMGKKILEVDAYLEERIFEVHPEVSFAALAGSHLRFPKRSWNGQHERRRLLADAGLVLPERLDAGHAPVDDVLDAAAAAWSAGRKAAGRAKTLPEDPPSQDGRIVAIWY
jgi:predicted RNase H-like nuclease